MNANNDYPFAILTVQESPFTQQSEQQPLLDIAVDQEANTQLFFNCVIKDKDSSTAGEVLTYSKLKNCLKACTEDKKKEIRALGLKGIFCSVASILLGRFWPSLSVSNRLFNFYITAIKILMFVSLLFRVYRSFKVAKESFQLNKKVKILLTHAEGFEKSPDKIVQACQSLIQRFKVSHLLHCIFKNEAKALVLPKYSNDEPVMLFFDNQEKDWMKIDRSA